MAARENQGLHIALILFVMLTVLLAVLVYFTFTSANRAADELAEKEEERQNAVDEKEAYEFKAKVLEMMLGYGSLTEADADGMIVDISNREPDIAEETQAILTQYKEDMLMFSAAYGDGVRHYRTLHGHLVQTITEKNGDLDTARTTEADLIAQNAADFQAAEQARLAAEARAAAERDSANQARTLYTDSSGQIQQAQQVSANQVTTARDAEQRAITEASDQIAIKDQAISDLEETRDELDRRLEEYEAEEFDIADGRISDVSSRTNIVWINVGFEDNLPQNATFAVYSQDSHQFTDEGIKGTIEVKRILGAHTAEAKVTFELVNDPILPGDIINTTTWSPGRVQRFAIAGFIDIDGDKRSDAQRLRNIINRNGGEVVAYIDDDGSIVGEMDATTRYLITGDDFRVGSGIDDATLSQMVKSTTELNNQARVDAVEKKYYQEMLEEMGYRGESSSSPVGGGGDGFVPRQPPSRGANGSAFDDR